jgi:BON domain
VAGGAVVRDVRHRIVQALHGNADLGARHVAIDVSGGVATLSGTVTTWQQRETAERAAAVINLLSTPLSIRCPNSARAMRMFASLRPT